MSSKYCCDNLSKDKAIECIKCEKDKCCAVYNKDEHVIYYHSKHNNKKKIKIGKQENNEGGIYDLHKAMMESMKNNSQTKPTIVKV
jgi:hypothetical protein